jgi:excisionase family DNA binding protein
MTQIKETWSKMNYPWTKKEEALLVDMVNAASEKYAGRINWREMKEIGNHTISSSQTRWSRNLKPLHIWNGKRYVLSSQNTLTEDKQTEQDMKHGKWTQAEDVLLVSTINKHLAAKVKWDNIQDDESPSGRGVMAMKERWRRISEFCEFEDQRFKIKIRQYVERNEQKPKRQQVQKTSSAMDGMDFMTTAEVGDFLRVSTATVRNMIQSNRLKAFGIPGGKGYTTYRIPKSEVEKLLQ